MAKTINEAWEVESPHGAIYTVLLFTDGSTSCDCPGWVFQRKGKPRRCKHTDAVVAHVYSKDIPVNWREITNHPDVNGPVMVRTWQIETDDPYSKVTIKKMSDGSFTCSCGWPKCNHVKDAKAADSKSAPATGSVLKMGRKAAIQEE